MPAESRALQPRCVALCRGRCRHNPTDSAAVNCSGNERQRHGLRWCLHVRPVSLIWPWGKRYSTQPWGLVPSRQALNTRAIGRLHLSFGRIGRRVPVCGSEVSIVWPDKADGHPGTWLCSTPGARGFVPRASAGAFTLPVGSCSGPYGRSSISRVFLCDQQTKAWTDGNVQRQPGGCKRNLDARHPRGPSSPLRPRCHPASCARMQWVPPGVLQMQMTVQHSVYGSRMTVRPKAYPDAWHHRGPQGQVHPFMSLHVPLWPPGYPDAWHPRGPQWYEDLGHPHAATCRRVPRVGAPPVPNQPSAIRPRHPPSTIPPPPSLPAAPHNPPAPPAFYHPHSDL
jgi:hypothetical protein